MSAQREHWGSRLGFVMAAAGSAIGLGTLWKFPYIVGANGGAAFIAVYVLCILIIGIPLFIAELILGRATQRGPVAAFEALTHPGSPWKVAGWLGVLASFLIMSYYSVLAGWGCNYALMSLNQWYVGKSANEIREAFDVLAQSGDITLLWHGLFTAITVGVVYPGIRQGIEFWSKWMTSMLLALVVLLVLYNIGLDGFGDAVRFIFEADMSKLRTASVIEALGLALFTLSLAQGIIITYGSYMRKEDEIPRTAVIIAVMVVVVALLCALAIFPVVFTFGMEPGSGFGLVFQTLPVLFAKLPGALLISVAFFMLFVFAALTSAIALVEVVVATLLDLYGWSRKRAAILVGCATFVCGIPSALSFSGGMFPTWWALYGKSFFETIDALVSVWLLPLCGLMTAIFMGWRFDKELASRSFAAVGSRWFPLWRFSIRYLAPIAVVLIILHHTGCI